MQEINQAGNGQENLRRTECLTGAGIGLSHLPRPIRKFVNRNQEIEDIKKHLLPHPENDCSCVLVHGAVGMGKTATAIKAAHEIRGNDDNSTVVYINCSAVNSCDDLAAKISQQIYHFPLNESTAEVKRRLISEKDLLVILLLDNFQYLDPLDRNEEANMNPEITRIDQTEGFKVKTFITEIITASTNVKLLVTSSVLAFFPETCQHIVSLHPLERSASFELLKNTYCNPQLDEEIAYKIADICDGIPLALISLASWQDHPPDLVQMMTDANPRDKFEKFITIPKTDKSKKIDVCLDACFYRLDQDLRHTLICLSLFKGHFTMSTAQGVFRSEGLERRILQLAHRSFLERNILSPKAPCRYSLLGVQKLYCQNKAQEGVQQVYENGRKRFIDHFLSILEEVFKKFLSKGALEACATFRREVENIMQLLDWSKSGTMDEERTLQCIDVFNKAAELLAKMMGEKRFNAVFNLLKDKCQQLQDKERLSDCLTSLGIKETFSCFFSPHLSVEAGTKAKNYFMEADRIQSDLSIDTGNSRAQCLAKYGRCISIIDGKFAEGKEMIKKAIAIRKTHEEEDSVMLGATYNDLAVVLSLESAHHQRQCRQETAIELLQQAVNWRTRKTLEIYRVKLGDHPFTATILNNLSKNYRSLGMFEDAKKCSEEGLKIRREFLGEHMETALSLYEVALVLKENNELQAAKNNLEQCLAMQEKVLDEKNKDLESTKKELEDVIQRLEDVDALGRRLGRIKLTRTRGSLLSDVLTIKPDLIEQMALFLDREMRLIANWKHFSNELKVDVNVINRLKHYADFSPTIRLFEHLEAVQPNLTIQQLKQAFLEIRRNDLFSLLTRTAALSDSDLVSKEITSRHSVGPSPNGSLLDEIALKLDVQSKILANWSSLALKLGVPSKTFKLFERRSTQSPTNQLFEYVGSTCPHMTVKTLEEALTKMERKDLLAILHEKSPQGENFIKDVMPPGSELLQMVANKLDTEKVPWEKNWLQLAYYLQIPSDVYQGFETREQRKSPTMEVFGWLVVHFPDIKLIDIVKALEKIQRNDVIQIITQHFPDTVNSFLEERSSPLSYKMSFDQPSATLKRDDRKQPGHCGGLPDPPYVLKGREVNCEEIIKSLLSNKAVEVVAPPGYGKTSVVVETAHRLIKCHGKYVAYVNPRGVTCVEDLGVTIIEALGEVPGDNTIRETLHRIRSLRAKNVVLMIENLDSLLHLEDNRERESDPHGVEYCPKMRGKNTKADFLNFISEIGKMKNICLVLTSTDINDFGVCFPIDIIQLHPLSETESSELFKERGMSVDEDTIKKLVDICGGIPLIICTVLSILRIRNTHNLTRRLSTCTPRELLQELSPDYLQPENRIDLCLEVFFHHLSEENQEVLTKLSTFPHRFTQEQFYAVFSEPKTDRQKLEMCLNSLKHNSLLRFEQESYYFCIHPFIRKFCSVHNQSTHKQAKSTFIRHYSDVVIALTKKFLSRESKCAIDEYRSERENIKEATGWCEVEHHDLPSEVTDYCIDAFIKAAVFLTKVMRKQEFESLFCKLSQNCPYDSKRHSACLTAVGMKIVLSCTCTPHICYRAWYRAKMVLSRANEIQLVEIVDDATRAQRLSKLGFILVREGLHTEGFEYLNQALKLRHKRWEQSEEDMDKVMIGACQNDIAASLMIQRKHLAAIETRRNLVLPLYESILGKDHAFVATTLSWIGRSYHELGEYDNAIKYATLALNIRQTLLGRHQETARSHYDLGVALSAKKDSERALKHLQHAIELQEEVLDTHEELVLSHQETAVVLKDLGNKEEAEREMERAGECAKRLDVLEVPLQS